MARALAFFLLAAALPGCQDPTQINLELSTDVLCSDLVETKLWARDLAAGEYDFERAAVDHRGPEPYCGADGRIGSIVAVPNDDDEAAVAFEVVTRVGNLTCADPPVYGPGCIIARRGVRFLPQTSLELPIRLTLDCLGVVCEATETCQAGQCVDAEVTSCTETGCGLETQTFVDPQALELAWTRVLTGERIHQLVAVGGRVIAAGEDAPSEGAMVAAYVDGGLEAWKTTFGGNAPVSTMRIGVDGGRVRALGQFSGSLAFGDTTLSAPAGGVFSVFFAVEGQPSGAESFTVSFPSQGFPEGGNVASVAFSGDSMAVSGACMGEVEVAGTQISSLVEVPAGFLGVVGAEHALNLWLETGAIEDVVFDPGGDLYVAGRAPVGGTVAGVAGEGDVFVARLDPQGQAVRWARGFETGTSAASTNNPRPPAKLALGPNGLAYLGSHLVAFETSAGVVHAPVEAAFTQTFALALSTDGEVTRAHSLTSEAGACLGRDLAWTPGGGIAIAAEVPPPKPGAPDGVSAAEVDGVAVETATGLVLIRLDDDGEHLVIPIGEAASGSVMVGGLSALAAASNGDLYVAGSAHTGSADASFSVGGELLAPGQGFLVRFAP